MRYTARTEKSTAGMETEAVAPQRRVRSIMSASSATGYPRYVKARNDRSTQTAFRGLERVSSHGRSVDVETVRESAAYLRKSCDYCGMRKRKCDGDGVKPCSRCEAKGLFCVYSMKRVSGPRPSTAKNQRPEGARTGVGIDFEPTAVAPRTERSLKRCRFSASPATGMVGMRENAFLVDFFDCLGIMPYTNESMVREGMVKIMLANNARNSSVVARDRQGGGHLDRSLDRSRDLSPGLIGVTACTFWSAVAVGALLQGRPQNSVETYIANARAVLGYSFDATVVEKLRMWIQITYVYAFSGDKMNVRVSALYVKELLNKLEADRSLGEVPEELIFVGRHLKGMSIYAGPSLDMDDLVSFCQDSTRPLPEVEDICTERDVSLFVTGAINRWGRELFLRALAQQRNGAVSEGGLSPPAEATAEQGMSRSYVRERPTNEPGGASPEKLHQYPVLGEEYLARFEQLDLKLKRSPITKGIVGFLINNFMGLWLSSRNNARGSLKRLSCCIDVLVRYPGLCRMVTGVHVIHVILALLAYEHAHELYDKLRCLYNPLRAEGALPFPPLEEWQGISTYCDHLHCRALSEEIVGREDQRAHRIGEKDDAAVEEVHGGEDSGDGVLSQEALSNGELLGGMAEMLHTWEGRDFVCQYERWSSPFSGAPMSQEGGKSVTDRGFHSETAPVATGLCEGLNAAAVQGVNCVSDHSDYSGGSRRTSFADIDAILSSSDTVHNETNADLLQADDWLAVADSLLDAHCL